VHHPGLAAALTEERRDLLNTDDSLVPVAALVDHVTTHGISSTAGLFESMKESPYSSQYEAAAAEGLADSVPEDMAATMLDGEFLALERQRIEAEYRDLVSRKLNDRERERFEEVQKRYAELKGVAAVGVDSPR
jgi:hypothetical protein